MFLLVFYMNVILHILSPPTGKFEISLYCMFARISVMFLLFSFSGVMILVLCCTLLTILSWRLTANLKSQYVKKHCNYIFYPNRTALVIRPCIIKVYFVSQSTQAMAIWLGRKLAFLDKQGTGGGRKTKFFINRRIACNKDLNTKEKTVELNVSVSGEF